MCIATVAPLQANKMSSSVTSSHLWLVTRTYEILNTFIYGCVLLTKNYEKTDVFTRINLADILTEILRGARFLYQGSGSELLSPKLVFLLPVQMLVLQWSCLAICSRSLFFRPFKPFRYWCTCCQTIDLLWPSRILPFQLYSLRIGSIHCSSQSESIVSDSFFAPSCLPHERSTVPGKYFFATAPARTIPAVPGDSSAHGRIEIPFQIRLAFRIHDCRL